MNPSDKMAYCIAAITVLIGMAWWLIRHAFQVGFNLFTWFGEALYLVANWMIAVARGYDMMLREGRRILRENAMQQLRVSMDKVEERS
jgi:hypothetical protein